jgi:hypothetical protein
MSNGDRNMGLLHHDVDAIISDAEHFLRDLKGHKRIKGQVRQDVRHLQAHVQRLAQHLHHMETEALHLP